MKQDWKLTAAILAVLAVPFGVALYQDSKPDDPSDAEAPTEIAAATPIELAPVEAPAPLTMPPEFFVDALGADSGKPGFHGDLAGVTLGMAMDAVPERAAAWARGELAARPHSTLHLFPTAADTLGSLQVDFPDDGVTAQRELADHFGPAISSPGAGRLWHDRPGKLRLALVELGFDGGPLPYSGAPVGRAVLRYEPYLALDELLAHDGDRFAFERLELLGARATEAAAAYGDDVQYQGHDNVLVLLPPTEVAPGATVLRLLVEDGVVTGYALVVEDSRADLALHLLEQGFGPASTDGTGTFVFESGARLAIASSPASLTVTVGR